MVKRKSYNVKLIALNDRAKKIINYYNNNLKVVDYDALGRPLNMSPSGEPAVFCVSPDGFWHGWFVLDKDVRFEPEFTGLMQSLSQIEKENNK